MKDLWRLWQLFRPYRSRLALSLLLALLTLLANVGLLALSGWFITAMAMAGAKTPAITRNAIRCRITSPSLISYQKRTIVFDRVRRHPRTKLPGLLR